MEMYDGVSRVPVGVEAGDEAVSSAERRMMFNIFSGLQHTDVPRATADEVYSVLADALPIASRCQKAGATRGICDLCFELRGEREVETTRHLALECPYSALVLDTVLKAALGVSVEDERVREKLGVMGWRQCVHEHRRLLMTGYRHCPGGGIVEEERTGRTPFRILMAETIAALVRRRRCNACRVDGDDCLHASVQRVYAQVRGRFEEIAAMTLRKAMAWEERLRILHPGWEPSEGEGPMEEWKRAWVTSGFVVMMAGGVRCCLPKLSTHVPGSAMSRAPVDTIAHVAPQVDESGWRRQGAGETASRGQSTD